MREREAAKHMATGTQRDFRREQELQRERERLHWNLCFENEMSNCRAQHISKGVGGEDRVCVCESISEFPVVSWLLIMRRRARELTLSASLNARIYVNSALSSAIPCYSFALPSLFYGFAFGFCFWLCFWLFFPAAFCCFCFAT